MALIQISQYFSKDSPSFLCNIGDNRTFYDSVKTLLAMIVILFALSAESRGAAGEDTFTLEFSNDGKLTLDARGVPLGTLLAEIQAQTKMALEIGTAHYDKPISLHFLKLPLQEAIKRILNGISYSCIENTTGHIEKIVTFPDTDKAPRHHESTVKSEPEASTSKEYLSPYLK